MKINSVILSQLHIVPSSHKVARVSAGFELLLGNQTLSLFSSATDLRCVEGGKVTKEKNSL